MTRLYLAVAAGGAIGAVARYGVGYAWPTAEGRFPWATLAINIAGSLAIGVLMVVIAELATGRVYLRPFVGVGILGGFTTFSAFAIETRGLLEEHPTAALGYFLATPVLAVTAAALGAALMTSALRARASFAAQRREP